MSDARQQWLLKVIAGPHQGAEIGLYAGKTLVGSDDECDVVLHDVLVAPQHLEIDLAASGITAAPLGGRVFVNGKRIRDARLAVPSFAFLSIGGSHLVIGPAEGKWPLLSSADVPELEKDAEPAPATSDKEPAPAAAPAADAAPAQSTSASAQPMTQPARAPSRIGPLFGIACGLLLLLGWGVVYSEYFSARGENSEELPKPDKPIARAMAVVEELGLAGSIKLEENAGRLTAVGYVDTENKQRELQAVFRATVPGMRTKIYSLEKIASSARSLLDNQHLALTITSLSEGKIKVTGKLASANDWVGMKQTLLSEVPGISEIEDSVEIEAPRPRISAPVQVAATVPLPGALAKPGAAPAQTAAAPPPLPVSMPEPDPETGYLITTDTIDTPESTIVTIRSSEDGLGYIRLNTGGVYFIGARLPYGGTVAKIETDKVSIIEKGQIRSLRQGDVVMKSKPITSTKS